MVGGWVMGYGAVGSWVGLVARVRLSMYVYISLFECIYALLDGRLALVNVTKSKILIP